MKRDQYLLGGLFRFSDSLASFLGLLKNEHVLARFLLNFKIKVLKTLSQTSSLIFIALLYVLLIILQHHGWYGIILSIYNNNASTNIRSLLDFFVVLKEITWRSCPPAVDGLGLVFLGLPLLSFLTCPVSSNCIIQFKQYKDLSGFQFGNHLVCAKEQQLDPCQTGCFFSHRFN